MEKFLNKKVLSNEAMRAKLGSYVLDGIADSSLIVIPGFCDVHVHFREPGFSYKETISTGCNAAAHGGYTAVCTMPNLKPVPDSLDTLHEQLHLIHENASIRVLPYGAITVEEKGETLSDMSGIAPYIIGFSDDGKGVQDADMMKTAMIHTKKLNRVLAAHCEDNSLLCGGYIHQGEYAKAHHHKGICSESEWGPIARDIELVKETGCAYHVCHISTKESVDLIRKAKQQGANITCETAPHYLIMSDKDLQEDGRFKMNPPLRAEEDRAALIEGILDGTIDMIATDHAPHSAEEKGKGLAGSAFGIVGLETAFAAMYTHFVKPGIISLEKLLDLMVYAPRNRFGIPLEETEFTVWDLNSEYTVHPENFLSKGKSTPFAGYKLFGKCIATVYNNNVVYMDPAIR